MSNLKLGKKIKSYREQLNMSQKELADKAKVSQSSLHYIENDINSPTISNLDKIAKALGVSVAELLDDRTA